MGTPHNKTTRKGGFLFGFPVGAAEPHRYDQRSEHRPTASLKRMRRRCLAQACWVYKPPSAIVWSQITPVPRSVGAEYSRWKSRPGGSSCASAARAGGPSWRRIVAIWQGADFAPDLGEFAFEGDGLAGSACRRLAAEQAAQGAEGQRDERDQQGQPPGDEDGHQHGGEEGGENQPAEDLSDHGLQG